MSDTVQADPVEAKGYKSFRCKLSGGLSVFWRIRRTPEGTWRASGLSKAKRRGQHVPLDFVPFEASNAVINATDFPTAWACECHLRSL